MATQEVKLPDIGEGVTEGELVKWLVKEGDSVEADQPVAEVMTDKATVEVPSPYPGKVKQLKAKEGDIIPIETTMLILEGGAGGEKGASSSSSATAHSESVSSGAMAASSESAAASTRPGPSSGTGSAHMGAANGGGLDVYPPVAESRVLATPGTRRLAREMSVDINQLKGSGLAGRVTREDVMQAKSSGSAQSAGGAVGLTGASASMGQMVGPNLTKSILRPAYTSSQQGQEERVALRGVRKKIAENLQMAKQVIPHFTLMDEAVVDELYRFRSQAKSAAEQYGVKVTYLPFVIKALIATLREFPMFNASIDDQTQEIVYKKYFNIGFAADTPNGLLVPVIKDADQKTILQLSQEIQALAQKARDGKLSLEEMKGATITITNIGSVGGTYATPIINHPEVAILGMYKITDKPLWKDGQWVPQKVMNYTVTCDHRLIDGAVAANFMKAFLGRIEQPSHLMLDLM